MMKTHIRRTNILLILSVFIGLTACTTSKVPEGHFLLTKNIFKGNKFFSNSKLKSYVKQKGLKNVPLDVWSYNLYSAKYEPVFDAYYLLAKEKRNQKNLDSLLMAYNIGNKLTDRMSLGRFFYRNQKKPALIDTILTAVSADNLYKFYQSKGFFNPHISYQHKQINEKKGKITYTIESGEPSLINTISYQIANAQLDSIYSKHLNRTKIKADKRFDLDDFSKERDRIVKLFKNQGYYGFDSRKNEVNFLVDSTLKKNEIDVLLKINKPALDSSRKYQPYYFKEINIYNGLDDSKRDSIVKNYEGYRIFRDKKHRFFPRAYTDLIYIEPGKKYRLDDVIKTKKNIFANKTFALSKFELRPYIDPLTEIDSLQIKTNYLVANIYLVPKKKHSFEAFVEASYSPFLDFGISPGLRYSVKNIFRGGETLDISTKATIGTVKLNDEQSEDTYFNAYEYGLNVRLTYPRFLTPFKNKQLVPKSFNPNTAINLSFSDQQNIGLGSMTFNGFIEYNLFPDMTDHFQLRLINVELTNNNEKDKYYRLFKTDAAIRNQQFDDYFNYDNTLKEAYLNGTLDSEDITFAIVKDLDYLASIDQNENFNDFVKMLERKSIITENNFIVSSRFSYEYNQEDDTDIDHPFSIKATVELAGNALNLLDKLIGFDSEKEELIENDSHGTIAGIRYSQFVRAEIDVRKKWALGLKKQIALRSFLGIALPYGNSELLPFNRSYYAGGANDIRAWRAYSLGPGKTKNDFSDFSIGNLKLTLNAEYRFPYSKNLYGAFFVDAGNIWDIDNRVAESNFKGSTFIEQLGVGAGTGIRYDLKFLLLRFDFAYKIHNPIYTGSEKWRFSKINLLDDVVVNFGINYPF